MPFVLCKSILFLIAEVYLEYGINDVAIVFNIFKEFECSLCQTITTLDESSVVELQRIAKVSQTP